MDENKVLFYCKRNIPKDELLVLTLQSRTSLWARPLLHAILTLKCPFHFSWKKPVLKSGFVASLRVSRGWLVQVMVLNLAHGVVDNLSFLTVWGMGVCVRQVVRQ